MLVTQIKKHRVLADLSQGELADRVGVRRDVTCQRDGTTVLPRAWDHLEVLLSIVSSGGGVNADAPALAV